MSARFVRRLEETPEQAARRKASTLRSKRRGRELSLFRQAHKLYRDCKVEVCVIVSHHNEERLHVYNSEPSEDWPPQIERIRRMYPVAEIFTPANAAVLFKEPKSQQAANGGSHAGGVDNDVDDVDDSSVADFNTPRAAPSHPSPPPTERFTHAGPALPPFAAHPPPVHPQYIPANPMAGAAAQGPVFEAPRPFGLMIEPPQAPQRSAPAPAPFLDQLRTHEPTVELSHAPQRASIPQAPFIDQCRTQRPTEPSQPPQRADPPQAPFLDQPRMQRPTEPPHTPQAAPLQGPIVEPHGPIVEPPRRIPPPRRPREQHSIFDRCGPFGRPPRPSQGRPIVGPMGHHEGTIIDPSSQPQGRPIFVQIPAAQRELASPIAFAPLGSDTHQTSSPPETGSDTCSSPDISEGRQHSSCPSRLSVEDRRDPAVGYSVSAVRNALGLTKRPAAAPEPATPPPTKRVTRKTVRDQPRVGGRFAPTHE